MPISRRVFVGGAAAGCASLAAGSLFGEASGARRPNVLLITADDMNWDTPGCYGGKTPGVTPNIDRLASQGMMLKRAHVTIAVCQPSRSVLMTGLYPHRNGAMGFEPIRTDVPSLQEHLRAGGYLNGIIAKNGHLAPREKFCWDFDVKAEEVGNGRSPDLYHDRAKEFFNQAHKAGKPFFLMANSQDPHRPFAGSEGEIASFGRHYPVTRTITAAEADVPGFLPDIPAVRREVAEYLTSSHRCDQTVGAVLRALSESGLEENTLVMFLSDNGMSFPYSKTNCYLNSTRTPWIVRWPGRVEPGSVDEGHFVSGIDYAPTILDACGLPPITGTDGKSFVPLLRGKRQSGRERVMTAFHQTSARQDYPMRAVQDSRYGYIYNAWSDGKRVFRNEAMGGATFRAMAESKDPGIAGRVAFFRLRCPEELYDLDKDPDALKNLAKDPAVKSVLNEKRRQMMEHLKATQDPLLPSLRAFIETGNQSWKAPPTPAPRRARRRTASGSG